MKVGEPQDKFCNPKIEFPRPRYGHDLEYVNAKYTAVLGISAMTSV